MFIELMFRGCKIEYIVVLIYSINSIIECCIIIFNNKQFCYIFKNCVFLFKEKNNIKQIFFNNIGVKYLMKINK